MCDAGVLRAHLAELPKEVRRFLGWASLFGSTIRQQDVCGLMDAEESSGSDGSSGEEAVDLARLSRVSMGASQTAIAEGWITAKGRGFYAFTHDRYRQAAQSLLADVTEQEREQMSLKVRMPRLIRADPQQLTSPPPLSRAIDRRHPPFLPLRVAVRGCRPAAQVHPHLPSCLLLLCHARELTASRVPLCLRCVPLLLRSPPVDPVYRDALYSAGHEALSQGAHDAAYHFLSASEQLCAVSGAWMTERREMFELGLTLVGLEQCSSRWTASSERIQGLYKKADSPCLRARVLFADARQKWVENDPRGHFALLLEALAVLGIHVAKGETDVAYAQVKSLLSVQHSAVGDLAPVTDERILFASELLAEATVAAFWAQQGDIDMIAFKLVELVLSQGMTPTACLGFVWLGFSASATFGDVGFGAQMTHAAVDLAQHPLTTTAARGRTLTLAGALAPYASPLKEARQMFQASTRVRHLSRLAPPSDTRWTCADSRRRALLQYSLAAGDVTFACFGRLHELGAALSESAHLADTVELADDVVLDIARWQPATNVNLMAAGTANCIRALHGETVNVTPLTAMDTDAFVEQRDLPAPSAANKVALTWYLGFKVGHPRRFRPFAGATAADASHHHSLLRSSPFTPSAGRRTRRPSATSFTRTARGPSRTSTRAAPPTPTRSPSSRSCGDQTWRRLSASGTWPRSPSTRRSSASGSPRRQRRTSTGSCWCVGPRPPVVAPSCPARVRTLTFTSSPWPPGPSRACCAERRWQRLRPVRPGDQPGRRRRMDEARRHTPGSSAPPDRR